MKPFKFLNFLFLLFTCILKGYLSEYCQYFPGDIKFIYHELTDEAKYIEKYGKDVLSGYRSQYAKNNAHLYMTFSGTAELITEGPDAHETQKPVEGHETQKPVESRETQKPVESHETQKPIDNAAHGTTAASHEMSHGSGNESAGGHELSHGSGNESAGGHELSHGSATTLSPIANERHENLEHETHHHGRTDMSRGNETSGGHETPGGRVIEPSGHHRVKVASRERILREESPHENPTVHLEQKENDKILPVWKLQLPRNTLNAALVEVDAKGHIQDKFDFYKDDFENQNLTTFHGRYSQHIDITPLVINLGSAYVICANLFTINGKKESTCPHCTLITADEDEKNQKSLVGEILEDDSSAESAIMKYSVKNMPFSDAMVKTTVISGRGQQARCSKQNSENKVVFESLDAIQKNSVIFVPIQNLAESVEYGVEVSMQLKWYDATVTTGLPFPTVETRYYLNEEENLIRKLENGENLHISRCQSNGGTN